MKNNVNLFWSSYDSKEHTTYEEWIHSKAKLSPFHALTLLSQSKQDNNVNLWTYQSIDERNLPIGIKVRNANEILNGEAMFNALKRGHSSAHVSDAVRIFSSLDCNGIVIDMDAVLLKQYPDDKGFFSTMFAKKTGGLVNKWGVRNQPFVIHDNSWDGKALSMFPCKISDESVDIFQRLAIEIVMKLDKPPVKNTKSWNFVMWSLKVIARKDKTSKVYQPLYFCPIPGWLPTGKCYSLEAPTRLTDTPTSVFGQELPSISTIIQESYVCQHFFDSVFKNAEIKQDPLFWLKIKDGSLLSEEARKIAGENWRHELTQITRRII